MKMFKMERRRRFFKTLVQLICLVIALFGILLVMYGQVLKDLSLPRAANSAILNSNRDHGDARSLSRKEELHKINTGQEQPLKTGRATRLSSSGYHGNGAMTSGADTVDLDSHDKSEVVGNGQQVLSAEVRLLDFREIDDHENITSAPRLSDSENFQLEGVESKDDIYSRSGRMKTMDNFPIINDSNRTHAFQMDSGLLKADLIRSVRNQLREMRDDFEKDSVRVFNRYKLPRSLTFLGKAIFRVVPDSFLPEYRSPCFHFQQEDGSSLACLPNVFLAGFPKCATTDLFRKLIRHPEVVATSKEPHWWTRTTFTSESVLHYLKHQTNLVRQMQDTGNRRLITLDASASTIWDSTYAVGKFGSLHKPPRWTHADVLRAVLPDARFLLMIREPTERLYSGYMAFDSEWHGVKSPQDFHHRLVQSLQDFGRCMGNYPLGTCANIAYNVRINVGMYSVFIRDWLKRYPRDQVYVIRTEDWAKDPTTELSRIFSFLGIDPLPQDALINITSSSRENRRNKEDRSLGELLPESRQLLDAFYTPFKEDLAHLLQDKKYLWTWQLM